MPYKVMFTRRSGSVEECYKNDYRTVEEAQIDSDFIKINGYWHDIDGVLFNSGSVENTRHEEIVAEPTSSASLENRVE